MIRKIKEALSNNRGGALAFGILVSLVVLLLFYCTLTYTQLKLTTKHIEDTAQDVLDTYTTTQGRQAIKSFKSGSDHTVTLDKGLYTGRLQDALGVDSSMTGYAGDTDTVRFTISDIQLNYHVSNTINSSVSFTLREPLYLFGMEVTALQDTVTVTSKYNAK